jgi:hypothetical protein
MYADFITHCILPRFFPHTDKAPHTHCAHWSNLFSEVELFFSCSCVFTRFFLKLKILLRNIDFDTKILKKYLVKAQPDKTKNAPSENIFTPL